MGPADAISDLPPGFTLDQSPDVAPPPGFTLDTAAAPSQSDVESSLPEGFKLDAPTTSTPVVSTSTDEKGLGQVSWEALQRGWEGFKQQGPLLKLNTQGNVIRQLDATEGLLASGRDPNSLSVNEDPYGIASMPVEERQKFRQQAESGLQKNVGEISEQEKKIRELTKQMPPPETVQKMLAAKTFGEFWDNFKQAPIQSIASVGLESLPQQIPGALAAIPAGMVAGPAGAAAAIGAGSYGSDFLGKIRENLTDAGVDWTKPEQVAAAIKNPELMRKVLSSAHAHAVVTGALDAASMGMAGVPLAPKAITQPLTREITNIGMQLPIQGALGAAGEAGGSVAAGEIPKAGDVGAEFIGEAVSTPAEVALATLSRGRVHARPVVHTAQPTAPEILDQISGAENANSGQNVPQKATAPTPLSPIEQVLQTATSERVDQPDWYYSPLKRAAEEKLPEYGTPEQFKATLSNSPGVKQEEMDWTKTNEFLNSSGPRVSKRDLIANIEENAVQVKEVKSGLNPEDESGPAPQYEEYTLPGPRSGYREILLTLPAKEPVPAGHPLEGQLPLKPQIEQNYQEPHFDEPNIVAHVRLTNRTDMQNNPVLFVDEIQSTWHESGGKEGYRGGQDEALNAQRLQEAKDAMAQVEEEHAITAVPGSLAYAGQVRQLPTQVQLHYREAAATQARLEVQQRLGDQRVPNAPFKTSWPELGVKRILRYAADSGVQRVAFIPGEQAFQIVTQGQGSAGQRQFLHRLYDSEIPTIAKKWAKRLGGTWGETLVPSFVKGERGNFATPVNTRVFYVDIPARAASNIQKGLPLFSEIVEPRVTVAPSVEAGVKFAAEARDAAKAFAKLAKKFKISAPIRIRLLNSVSAYPTALGALNTKVDGSYDIEVNVPFHRNAAEMFATIAHEFGHLVMREKYARLSDSEKLAIQRAYESYRDGVDSSTPVKEMLARRDNAVTMYLNSRRITADTKPLWALSPEKFAYWTGFDEWFAEQVARWATTSERPLGIVERTFKQLGAYIREILSVATLKFTQSFEPAPAVKAWLDSFIDTAPPFIADVHDALDVKTQVQNQAALAASSGDPDVQGVPRQAETQVAVQNVQQVFDGAPPKAVREFAAHADKMNLYLKYRAGLEQLIELNPRFTPLLEYGEKVRAMFLEKTKIQDAALRVQKAWRRLGSKMSDNVTAFIDDLTNMTYRSDEEIEKGIGRQPTREELLALQKRHEVSPEGMQVVARIRQIFTNFLTLMEANANEAAIRNIKDPAALTQKLSGIKRQTDALRTVPYFPFTRFGRHYIQVKDAAGKTAHFETVERKGIISAEGVQRRRAVEIKEQFPGHTIETGLLPETVGPMIGLPPLLLEQIANEMELTPAQRDALQQLQFELSPAMSFKKRMMHKSYTPGYSADFKRAFAKYFLHGANFYANTKYAWALRGHIADAGAVGGLKAHKIRDYMQDHLQNNIIDARNDWGFLKGLMFHWVIAYNPASAALNLTQVPLITGPFLGAKFGDVRAQAALAKAYANVKNFYRRESYKDATAFEMKAIDYGIKTGRISETQATELAGLAQGNNLLAFGGGNVLREGFVRFLQAGAWMFETAEQVNRRVTFRAALDLAMNNPAAKIIDQAINTHLDEYNNLRTQGFSEAEARAIVTAAYSVDQTQYVYNRYSRPRFMRGGVKGSILVFFRYIEATMAVLGANKSDVLPRFLLMMMVIAGPLGLPFAEDANDLIRALAYRLFGKDFDPKREARKFIISLFDGSVSPDLILHGLARYGFGAPAVLDWLGGLATGRPGRGLVSPHHVEGKPVGFAQNVPVPVIDMSRNVGMGNIMRPNLGQLMMPGLDTNKVISEQTRSAGGAVAGSAIDILKALRNTDSYSDFKNWERAVPRWLGNASAAYRTFSEERIRGKGGPQSASTVLTYDPRDPEQMAEIIAMGLGFQPTRKVAQWDRIMMQNDVEKFYDIQKQMLMSQAFEAQFSKEAKEREKVMTAIKQFNAGLPDDFKGKSITSDGLKQSMQTRMRAKTLTEAGLPTQKSAIGVAKSIQNLFPESTIDVRKVR